MGDEGFEQPPESSGNTAILDSDNAEFDARRDEIPSKTFSVDPRLNAILSLWSGLSEDVRDELYRTVIQSADSVEG